MREARVNLESWADLVHSRPGSALSLFSHVIDPSMGVFLVQMGIFFDSFSSHNRTTVELI